MAMYATHPGTGKLDPASVPSYIDNGTLATLYGLGVGEYTIGTTDGDPAYIHLYPRKDGKYKNIKRELGDTGTQFYQDYPAFMYVSHDGKWKSKRQIQPQYKDSFRDKRGEDRDRIL